MKKIFGGINLTWKKLFAFAILIGIYTGIIAMIPMLKDTSFNDITVTFEVWIFFGIFIIMNSKSAKDSALKCFVFFLISQPLVYIVQDLINHSNLFMTYYRFWIGWTIACIPMGFIGYYMKKDKWWGLLILTPIMILLGSEYSGYLSRTMFFFPRHLLTSLFCVVTLIVYPLVIFKNKKVRIVGEVINVIIIILMSAICLINPPKYSTDLFSNGDTYQFDDTYKVYLKDSKYGNLSIEYNDNFEDWMVHAEFKKGGKTEFVLEAPNGEKRVFDITIEMNKYSIKEK